MLTIDWFNWESSFLQFDIKSLAVVTYKDFTEGAFDVDIYLFSVYLWIILYNSRDVPKPTRIIESGGFEIMRMIC